MQQDDYAESVVLLFPSAYPDRVRSHELMKTFVNAELAVREGHAHDLLRELRISISTKSVYFRSDKPSWSQAEKTRFGNKMQRYDKKIKKHRDAYNSTYSKLLILGLDVSNQNFRHLSLEDCRLVTMDHSAEQPGEKKDTRAWFWRIGAYRAPEGDSTVDNWDLERE